MNGQPEPGLEPDDLSGVDNASADDVSGGGAAPSVDQDVSGIELPFGLSLRAFAFIVAGLAALLVVAWVLFVAPFSPLRGGFTRLTPDSPTLAHDGITITLTSEEPLRVRVSATPREQVLSGEGPDRDIAFPPYLTIVSPLYRFERRGAGSAAVEVEFGLEAEPVMTLDVYRWDDQAAQWVFVPSEPNSAGSALLIDDLPEQMALFQVGPLSPLVGSLLEEGQVVDGVRASTLNLLLINGPFVQEDGTLIAGPPVGGFQRNAGYAVLPVIHIPRQDTLFTLLEDENALQAHVAEITAFVVAEGFQGIALHYPNLDAEHAAAYTQLVKDLKAALDQEGKLLAVRVPTPTPLVDGWDAGPYDWRTLGQQADVLIVALPGGPGEYRNGGLVDDFLKWATRQVSRVKLYSAFSSLGVNEWAGSTIPISYDYALGPLGMVGLETRLSPGSTGFSTGDSLRFNLSGEAVNIGRDESTGLYTYEVYAGDGYHRIWIVTAAGLRQRLDWLSAYHLGGVIIEDLLSDGNAAGMLPMLNEFKVNLASSAAPELVLSWTVSDASGAQLAGETTGLGTPLAWLAGPEGEYTISAQLVGVERTDRGSARVRVGAAVTEPAPTLVEVGQPAPVDEPAPTAEPAAGVAPPPVAVAGSSGGFELGGQVNNFISRPDLMRRAGMTWAKFQLSWSPGMNPDSAAGYVQQGHAGGFKVLLSVPGQEKHPSSINFAAYVEFLRGVARYGPDAIEVWNEQNIDFEWPRGRISGESYVENMLAPAFNAIKSVNANIMVISGALAPTGAFYADGGCSVEGYGCDDWLYLEQMAQAGAADYMDCVGAHFNAGATPPSATTGHPADPGYGHYSWYYPLMAQLYGGTFGRPICWTELGYLTGEGYGSVPERFNWAADNSVAEQAAWLAEAAQLGMTQGNVRLMIVWNVDFTNWGDDPMAGYAIIRPGGGCPACDALGAVMP